MSLLRVKMKFCNQDISNTITAMSYKLGQLTENNEKTIRRKLEIYFIFSSSCPLRFGN